MKKLLLLLLLLFTTAGFSQTSRDTLINWQVYKDNQLLFKSHIFDVANNSVTIKKSDKFSNLTIFINNCIRTNETGNKLFFRKGGSSVSTFIEVPDSNSSLVILSNKELKNLLGLSLNEQFTIEYADSPKSTITLGTIMLTDR